MAHQNEASDVFRECTLGYRCQENLSNGRCTVEKVYWCTCTV